jgi:hypothetical protein
VAHLQLVAHDERARWCTFDVVVAGPGGVVVLVLRGLQLHGVLGRFGEARAATRCAPPRWWRCRRRACARRRARRNWPLWASPPPKASQPSNVCSPPESPTRW